MIFESLTQVSKIIKFYLIATPINVTVVHFSITAHCPPTVKCYLKLLRACIVYHLWTHSLTRLKNNHNLKWQHKRGKSIGSSGTLWLLLLSLLNEREAKRMPLKPSRSSHPAWHYNLTSSHRTTPPSPATHALTHLCDQPIQKCHCNLSVLSISTASQRKFLFPMGIDNLT